MVDLSGSWLVHPGEHDLHQRFLEPGFDDSSWVKADVPGHWRSLPELSEHDGPVLYRRSFDAPPPQAGHRRFLQFEGIFYDGDIWLDGRYIGATTGYFLPHTFEVTGVCAGATEHTLAVEVACAPQDDRSAKRAITGVFSHWDCFDARWNPGGIWRPVRFVDTGAVRIARCRVVCTSATEERGRLRLDISLDAEGVGAQGTSTVQLVATLEGAGVDLEATRTEQLVAGENRLEWVLEVDRPPRWWPRRLGDQPLVDVSVRAEIEGEVSDTAEVRTGFREVRLHDWKWYVNGEPIYVMGANHAPTRMALAEATPDEMRRDIELAVEANLDMLRVHAHVTRPEFYEAADSAGLLLWQDFPLQWGYARGLRRQAVRQAEAMVDLLGHHPSVALWCAHNEPLAVDIPTGEPPPARVAAKVAASMVAPTWNKTVLDRSIARTIDHADGSRPVNRHSGILPGPTHGGTDSHLYFGWYFGHMADLQRALRAWPRLARFVSEFGAQAVPDDAGYLDEAVAAGRWPDLDWDMLLERHALQKHYFDRVVPPGEFADLDEWRAATQEYQAALLQLQIEDLRRLRYRPTGGFLQFCFADALPSVTWSVLDHERRPKAGFAALRDACRPVLPMLDPRTGDVHVVSELPRRLDGAEIELTTAEVTRRFSGDVKADAVTFVGSLRGPVREGSATVALRHPHLGDEGRVSNSYGSELLRRAGRKP